MRHMGLTKILSYSFTGKSSGLVCKSSCFYLNLQDVVGFFYKYGFFRLTLQQSKNIPMNANKKNKARLP